MSDTSAPEPDDELREEYDLSQLKGGVRGKYYEASPASNLALIEPALADIFPDAQAVNRALRVLAEAARASKGHL